MDPSRWVKCAAVAVAFGSVFLPWLEASDPFITVRFSGLRLALRDSPLFVLNPYAQYAPVVFLGPVAGALILWRSFRLSISLRWKVDLPITLLLGGIGVFPVLWLIAAMLDEAPRLLVFGQVMSLGVGAYLSFGAFGSIMVADVITSLVRWWGIMGGPTPDPAH